jgi:hypothetical protein
MNFMALLQRTNFLVDFCLFDIGKIQSVFPDNKCDDGGQALVKVIYVESVYKATLHLMDYATLIVLEI